MRHSFARMRTLVLVALVLLGFLAALLWWTGGVAGEHTAALAPSYSTTTDPAPGASPPTPAVHPNSASPARGTLADTLPLALSTGAQSAPSGTQRVVLTVRSDAPIGALGYKLRGQQTPKVPQYYVNSPFTLATKVVGPAPRAVLAIQVGPNATWARCTITVDGVVRSTAIAHGPFRVIVCVA